MNNSISGWNFESDTCITNQKKPTWNDQGIVELLWQNGQVVMHNQSYRKPAGNNSSDLRSSGLYGNSSKFSQEDVTVPWIQYQPEDPLEQELCSNLLSELPPCEVESYKPIRQLEEGNFVNSVASSAPYATSSSQGSPMPALRFHAIDSSQKINDFGGSKKIIIVSSAPASAQPREKYSANMSRSEAKECSVMTVGSSHCGRNHILQDPDLSKASSNGVWDTTLSSEPEAIRDCVQRKISGSDKGKSEMVEPTMTSSSGGSGSSIGRTCSLSTRSHGQKRKGTDAEASEEQSEATELKSADGNSDKASQRVGSSKRSRAAEVHNLSERRRRERINEKMRALQKLIPNSNKTDKASMLEEAIEYLKSLQLQLQLMWMGAGMTPMMFPGIQHYMSQMSMGLAPSSLPSIHNPIQLPRVTHDQSISMVQMPNQAVLCQNPVLGAFNYQNQMQNHCLSEQYARCMGYLMQSASQPVNNVFGYGSQAAQLSQTMVAPSNSSGPMTMSGSAANIDDGERGKMGSTFN